MSNLLTDNVKYLKDGSFIKPFRGESASSLKCLSRYSLSIDPKTLNVYLRAWP